MKNDKQIESVREVFKVPEELRIAQFLYNQFRDYEESLAIHMKDTQDNLIERSALGINIFYVEDNEFIKHINKKLK